MQDEDFDEEDGIGDFLEYIRRDLREIAGIANGLPDTHDKTSKRIAHLQGGIGRKLNRIEEMLEGLLRAIDQS